MASLKDASIAAKRSASSSSSARDAVTVLLGSGSLRAEGAEYPGREFASLSDSSMALFKSSSSSAVVLDPGAPLDEVVG